MLNILDWSLKLNGYPLENARAHFSSIIAVSEKEFEAFTNQKREEIVCFHLSNNIFYQNLVKTKNNDFSIENWNDLPVLTKTDFQKPLSERLSFDYNIKNVYINRTSGSSGDPFDFAKDKFLSASSLFFKYISEIASSK